MSQPVEIFYGNGGNGKLEAMLAYYRAHPDLSRNLIVLQEGFRSSPSLYLCATADPLPPGDCAGRYYIEFGRRRSIMVLCRRLTGL